MEHPHEREWTEQERDGFYNLKSHEEQAYRCGHMAGSTDAYQNVLDHLDSEGYIHRSEIIELRALADQTTTKKL